MLTSDSAIFPGEEFDGYKIIRFLGRGGFGEVWLCRSQTMGGYHALKFISGRDTDLLEKEHHSLGLYRSAAARLHSLHLVPIEHINRRAGGLCYVMPLADGITDVDPTDATWQPLSMAAAIDARVNSNTWLSSSEIIGLILPILNALQCLSDAGLVHRDVKPENILFFNGSPCLGDISLLGEDTETITRRGTPGYATPSWYRGGLPDMYGAAATLYTLLTGNPPDKMGRAAFIWPPQGEQSLTESERAQWKRLHAVIRRATEEKVGERFVDFRAMAAAISGAVTPTYLTPPKAPSGRKSKLPHVLIALLMMGVAIVVLSNLNRLNNKSVPSPTSNPVPTQKPGRQPKIVNAQGYHKSLRERVIEVIPSAISSAPSGSGPRLDVSDYADRSAILKAYQSRDYSQCLELLNTRIENQPALSKNPLCLLFKSLLFKQLNREDEIQALLKDYGHLTDEGKNTLVISKTDISMHLTLLEALDLNEEAESLVSTSIATAQTQLQQSGAQSLREDVHAVVMLYRDRARSHILQGDMAEALADELTALKLPPGTVQNGNTQTVEEAQQIHLNTIVMEWELLEQEFPAYVDYLEKNGWPEPKPDHRDLKALD